MQYSRKVIYLVKRVKLKGGLQMDTKALRNISYGLYIITTKYGDKQSGCVVNTLQQVTSSPAKLSVAINKENYTSSLIQKSGYFCGSVLSETISMDTIAEFGFKSGREVEKFENVPYEVDVNGIYYIKEGTTAVFSCKVEHAIDVGTHIMFIGEIEDMKITSKENTMTYAYYHSVKKGTTPKLASSYIEADKVAGYQCSVCSYIFEGEKIPEDYSCPICKQGADKFVKL